MPAENERPRQLDGLTGLPWIGVNFWSRVGGSHMWRRYDGTAVRDELALLARHGCNVTRSFCSWPDFVPEPERLDATLMEHFADFLDAHVETGISTLPTFIVGHMSGENRDPDWRQGRDLYRDVWLVSQQAWFVAEIARRFGSHPAIAGWILSNEMPLYGGSAASSDVTAWAGALVQALRSAGARQPVSTGDGAWGIEMSGDDNGFSLRELRDTVDFVGPHTYPMEDDQVRQMLTAAFACELAGGVGLPVILEEFGLSSDFADGQHAAAYYRQVLHSTLLAGARGWLAWSSSDYDSVRDLDPYRHHPFELHFGLIDQRGQPKPQMKELAAFAELVAGLARSTWERVGGEVALVVPEHFERAVPFTTGTYRSDIRRNLLQSYIAAREADLPVALVRERDGLPTESQLYLLPCAKLATTSGMDAIADAARAGASVYASYFAGSTPVQRGPWLPQLQEIFGVRHLLRYGLVDTIEDDEVEFRFVEPFGDITAGTTLSFRASGTHSGRSFLPVEPAGASVVAVDAHGRPALLRHPIGAGHAVLSTYPLEYLASNVAAVNPEDTWRLYSAIAVEAGVPRPVRVDDPRVMVGRVRTADREIAVLANCSPDTVHADVLTAAGIDGDRPQAALTMQPFAVQIFRTTSSNPPSQPGAPHSTLEKRGAGNVA